MGKGAMAKGGAAESFPSPCKTLSRIRDTKHPSGSQAGDSRLFRKDFQVPIGPSPMGDSLFNQDNLQTQGGKLRYKAASIHLFIYVYLLQKKRTDQETRSEQAWGCCPLPTSESERVHDKYAS